MSKKNLTYRPPAPPKGLQASGRSLWRAIVSEYRLDSLALIRLADACKFADREQAAAAQVAAEGLTILDRFDKPKPHPLLAEERHCRQAKLAIIAAMGLDVEELRPRPGRPPKSAADLPPLRLGG